MGAIITVLALALDPLSQAMVEHRSCDRAMTSSVTELLKRQHPSCVPEMENGIAEVPRTNNYSASNSRYTSRGDPLEALDPQMVGAVYQSLLTAKDTTALIDFKCTARNCVFETSSDQPFFSTLAICHSCQGLEGISANASFNGWQLDDDLKVGLSNWSRSARFLASRETPAPGLRYYNISSFFSLDILSVAHPNCHARECEISSSARFKDMRPFAVQCRLDACVKTLRAEVRDGVYSETEMGAPGQLLKSHFVVPMRKMMQTKFSLVTDSIFTGGMERPCVEVDEGTPNSVKLNLDHGIYGQPYLFGEKNDEKKVSWKSYPQECVWAIDAESWFHMRELLRNLMVSTIDYSFPYYSFPDHSSASGFGGHKWMRNIYANGSGSVHTAEKVFEGLANSITVMMRNRPYGARNPGEDVVSRDLRIVTGRSLGTQTCIYVNWAWSAYPLALLVVQWTFSILVLRKTRQRKESSGATMVWKSSPLALVFNGLDDGLRDKQEEPRTLKQMDMAAEKFIVRLVPTDEMGRKGFKFCES